MSYPVRYVSAQGFKNLLTNGEFLVHNRRNAGGVSTTGSPVYVTNGWYYNVTSGSIGYAQGTNSPAYPFAKNWTISTTGAATYSFGQRIEAARATRAAGKTCTMQMRISDTVPGSDITWKAYYPASADLWTSQTEFATGTLTTTAAMTQQSFSFDVPANGIRGISIELICNFSATRSLKITGCQLEVGNVATDFEFLPPEEVLQQCLRHKPFVICYNYLGVNSPFGFAVTTTKARFFIPFKVPPIKAPTSVEFGSITSLSVVSIDGATNIAASSYDTTIEAGYEGAVVSVNVAGGLTAGVPYMLRTNTASGYIDFTGGLL